MKRIPAILTTAFALSALSAGAQLKTQVPQSPASAPATAATSVSTTVAPPASATQDEAKRIERDKAISLVAQKKAIYVDVRAKEQYDAGHIKGAINIPEWEIAQRLKELPTGKMIITYCA